ncbi:hypothetical protein EH165_09200 [Nakamurella antarctica]|uniref:Uncharacterized protein n=1 Tax=Nakamurella antarctica TaxID=1902245 RepID=A0A3G8ZNA5_9ACTN|nr:hypothetical protein [Nakamurella antarctica]AZI58287.1 hypothetical protein EH165_09200 [Nakamurella antarctica]
MSDTIGPENSHHDSAGFDGADPAFDRVVQADPASGVRPDLGAIRAAVLRATSVEQAPVGPPSHPEHVASVTSIRRAPTTRWLQVAAATAAVLAVGLGGYAIGSKQVPTQQAAAAAATTAPSVAMSRPGVEGGAAPAAAPVRPGSPGGEMLGSPQARSAGSGGFAASGADGKMSSMPGYFGRTVFTQNGLSTEGATAAAYGFDPAAVATSATVAALAAKLGVTGEPRLEFNSWTVGASDGTGPVVSLSVDGVANFNYYNPQVDAWYCPQAIAPSDAGSSSEPGPDTTPGPLTDVAPSCAQRDVGSAPTGDEAIARFTELLTTVGVDPATLEFEASPADPSNPGYSYVSGYALLDGARNGISWSIGFSGPEISSLYGSLAPLVSAGNYPVISPADAVARLGDPRFGAANVMYAAETVRSDAPVPATVPALAPPADGVAPAAPTPGAPIAWPVTTVTITGATLGLALQYLDSGASLLIPTYTLTDGTGATWSVIAVADSALNFG